MQLLVLLLSLLVFLLISVALCWYRWMVSAPARPRAYSQPRSGCRLAFTAGW